MPIHDWTRVEANLFHDFHQTWAVSIRNTLNGGLLPKGYTALVEQHAPALVPDVLALKRATEPEILDELMSGGVITATEPKTRYVIRAQQDSMAARGNRITIRHQRGRIVCVIEIVSPGNKNTRYALRAFVEKSIELLRNGVHLLIIDLFPPSKRDPQGIHKAIWDEIDGTPFELPPNQPLTLAAYIAGLPITARVEPIGVGEVMPDMPAYLDESHYVPVPLEATYMATWASYPEDTRVDIAKGDMTPE
jgi:Protein of unknown function (DUF4058)